MNEQNLTPDLLRLASLYGINQSYWDAQGTQHFLSERTLRQLLVGFGVLDSIDASEQTIGQSVHAERVALWRTGLPPVVVVHESSNTAVELVMPAMQLAELWQWRIDTEDGETHEATFTPSQLTPSGDHHDVEGWANAHRTIIDDQELLRFRLPLPALPCGYHQLSIKLPDDTSVADGDTRIKTQLIVTPTRCYLPAHHSSADSALRLWGIALQLYAVRSNRNWGMGDFTDLTEAVGVAAHLGAHVVGINPLHALFLHVPEQASPYSPSSRLYLNPLYIDVESVDGFDALISADQPNSALPPNAWLDNLRRSKVVDYSAVAETKMPVLEALFDTFYSNHLDQHCESAVSYLQFQAEHGTSLEKFACYEALREAQADTLQDMANDWHHWPKPLHDPDSEAVAHFVQENQRRIQFHTWLQWLAHQQLDLAAVEAKDKAMKIGLYRDLAVGVASGGSDTWSRQSLFGHNVHVGAPPDEFSANGQDWGLPPLNPQALRESGYELFTNILRSNMRAAGALRIDHVMGLMRIFCIPAGEKPSNGAYVNYPIDDLLAIVVLESQRQQCIVIGEDLGTVPDGLREKLHAADVLSYKLMYFEKHYDGDQQFRQPQEYLSHALVGANTHDLPTLRSFWSGSDLALRESLDLFPNENMFTEQMEERAHDRNRLLTALGKEALLSQIAIDEYRESGILDDALILAIHTYLARTRSLVLVANLEDLLGQEKQINLPGTDRDLYPNWRHKLPLTLEHWLQHESLCDCAVAINKERA